MTDWGKNNRKTMLRGPKSACSGRTGLKVKKDRPKVKGGNAKGSGRIVGNMT